MLFLVKPFSEPRMQWFSGSRHRERLFSDSRIASVKHNRHHHHQMRFWLHGSHDVKDVIKQAQKAQSRPEGPQLRSRGPE